MGKIKNKDNTLICILIGTGISILFCIAATGGLAQLMLTERVGECSSDWCVTVILLLSSIFGCLVSVRFWSKKPIYLITINTVLVIVIVLLCGLMIDGRFRHTLFRIGAVMGGGLISGALCLNRPGKPVRRKMRYR